CRVARFFAALEIAARAEILRESAASRLEIRVDARCEFAELDRRGNARFEIGRELRVDAGASARPIEGCARFDVGHVRTRCTSAGTARDVRHSTTATFSSERNDETCKSGHARRATNPRRLRAHSPSSNVGTWKPKKGWK